MRSTSIIPLTAAAVAVQGRALSRSTSSLADVCTVDYAKSVLPSNPFGITIDHSSITTAATYNASVSGDVFFPDATIDYCNVTFAYSHNGKSDQVYVQYWMPDPSKFQNRYLSTGGGAYAITSASMSNPGGIIYGAVAGTTDGGFGSFDTDFDAVFLAANGSINYDSLYMFGYQAHHELSIIGKEYTKNFFGMGNGTKLYSYYQGCSEGGREGWSQVQRYGDEWDGAAIGAPAFRFSFQQLQHLYSNLVEQTIGYYPPTCELDTIINATINACDELDGKKDGVIARSDLCKLNFDLDTLIGKSYYCAASSGGSYRKRQATPNESAAGATPVQNGTITAKGVEVAKEIIKGLRDSEGRQVYFSYQPGADFEDAATQYNSETGEWELSISGAGGEFLTRFLQLRNTSDLETLDGATYDTLKEWMIEGWQMYEDSLETDWPDLTPFHKAGGKVIHFHGESDPSIPTASSVRYWEAVRDIMYPNMTYDEGADALKEWYRLFLVPGAAHCTTNSEQPNGPFPQTNLAVLIDWVEKDITPVTLNATHLAGDHKGDNAQLCAWPLRPKWSTNGTMECEFDQASYESWKYDFTGVPLPVY